MTKKIITVLAVIILAICLMSGGCYSPPESSNLKAWKDIIKLVPEKEKTNESKSQEEVKLPAPTAQPGETTPIKLYFARSGREGLGIEERTIVKTPGIARSTMEELIKGPQSPEYSAVFPQGTSLRDINIKQDGTCVLDLSSELRGIKSQQEEKLMIEAVSKTLGQFPTVNEVTFMIDGQEVQSMNSGIDLSLPIKVTPSQ